VHLLLQCGLYSRDFEDWDHKTASDKILTNLRTFVQECYTRRLNATNITAGLQGYVQNAFAALGKESNEDDDDVQTVITQMAALTTQSQLTATTMAETQASVAAAINQLAANQQVMQQHLQHSQPSKTPCTKQGHQHPPSHNLPSPLCGFPF
jgi:hypothetical protein